MLARNEAAPLLRPLAGPTLLAFGEARSALKAQREALADEADRMAPPVLALLQGFQFWAPFASFLSEHYRTIDSVVRDATSHPLEHVWYVGSEIQLRLKSEIDQLSKEQRMLTLDGVRTTRPTLVVLTWQHLGSDRAAPTFVGMDAGRARWNLPAEALVADQIEVLRPSAPKATVRMRRPDAQDEADAQHSP